MSRKPITRMLSTTLLLVGLIFAPAIAQATPRTGADSSWDLLTWLRTAWTAIWDLSDAGPGTDPG
jgi:hypothetical protein